MPRFTLLLPLLIAASASRLDDHLERAERLLSTGKCHHVYLDIGTNIGIQIRKLFEPHLYPAAAVLPFFNEHFGEAPNRNKHVCAFGFEPNPAHTRRLTELEDAYTRAGYSVVIFTEVAAGGHAGEINFYNDTHAAKAAHEWGGSVIPWQNHKPSATVPILSMAQFVNKYIRFRTGHSHASKVCLECHALQDLVLLYIYNEKIQTCKHSCKVLAKVDIEGAEFEMLSSMLVHGALCALDFICVEWHAWILPADQQPPWGFDKTLSYIANATEGCKLRMIDLDDEMYGHGDDPNPLPKHAHSKRMLRG